LAGDPPTTAARPIPIQLSGSGEKQRDRNISNVAGRHTASLPLQNVPHLSRSRLSVPSQQSQASQGEKRCGALAPLTRHNFSFSLERDVPVIGGSPCFLSPGGTCRPRATLPGAAGPPGGRRPGKPRRDPYGGTQAVSPRSGSPREAWREGPNVPLISSLGNVARGLQAPPRER